MALELKTADDVTEVTDAELIPDGDPETVYGIRHITLETVREIQKACTRKVPNKRTHVREDVVDWDAVADQTLDHVIAYWRGVVAKGKELDCVLANKRLLDGVRRSALLERAGMNEVAASPERREESFRPTA